VRSGDTVDSARGNDSLRLWRITCLNIEKRGGISVAPVQPAPAPRSGKSLPGKISPIVWQILGALEYMPWHLP
jgi:hypothetical protein